MQSTGTTDLGQPLVLSEHTCEFWLPGKVPDNNSKTCWYCRYADFHKHSNVILFQSVCHCPNNRVRAMKENTNETQPKEGGATQ